MDLLADKEIFEDIISSIADTEALNHFKALTLFQLEIINNNKDYQRALMGCKYFTSNPYNRCYEQREPNTACETGANIYGKPSVPVHVELTYSFIVYLKKIDLLVFTDEYIELSGDMIIFNMEEEYVEIHTMTMDELILVTTNLPRDPQPKAIYVGGIYRLYTRIYENLDTIARKTIERMIKEKTFKQ